MKVVKPSVKILSKTTYTGMLRLIEKAGRTCYKSESKITSDSAESFVKNIIKRGHESVLEHASITIRIICDRGISHQLVRHRIASYSQESTVWCNYSKDKFNKQVTFIMPLFFYECLGKKTEYSVWKRAMKNAEDSYMELLKIGRTPAEARSVLPNSLKTEVIMTMNIRAWREFFHKRYSIHVHPQMFQITRMILDIFYKKYKIFFDDIQLT
jgi:thymidylate synthase (FAD)